LNQVLFSSGLTERGVNLIHWIRQNEVPIEEVSREIMESISDTESPQGILAVIPFPKPTLPARLDFVIITDAIRDPGNLGTLLRTASASGVQALLLSPGTTDPYSPKVVRSAMGAHFQIPFIQMTWEQITHVCQNNQPLSLNVLVADMNQGLPYWQHDLRQPVAFIIGNESEGPGEDAQKLATDWISIPMPGNSESLNAAVAAGILLFEAVRQRGGGDGNYLR
jgi:RNA methyltransferase, TrmH family